jgi:hypothetical protein
MGVRFRVAMAVLAGVASLAGQTMAQTWVVAAKKATRQQ